MLSLLLTKVIFRFSILILLSFPHTFPVFRLTIIGLTLKHIKSKILSVAEEGVLTLGSIPPTVIREVELKKPGSVVLFPENNETILGKSLQCAKSIIFTPDMLQCTTFQFNTWKKILEIIFDPPDASVLAKAFGLVSKLLENFVGLEHDLIYDEKYPYDTTSLLYPIAKEILLHCCLHFGALAMAADEVDGYEPISTIAITASKVSKDRVYFIVIIFKLFFFLSFKMRTSIKIE